MLRQIKKPAHHIKALLPDDSFALPKQAANPTSNNPAMIKIIQFMFLFFR
jgi:hypothetical protein